MATALHSTSESKSERPLKAGPLAMEETPLDATAASPGPIKRCQYCGKGNTEAALVCDCCSTPTIIAVLQVVASLAGPQV